MLPDEIRDLARKPSTVVNWTRGHFFCRYHTVCKQDTVIIITEGGGLMDDACAVSIGDVVVDKNPKGLGPILCNEQ
jgi:hypothetical protein